MGPEIVKTVVLLSGGLDSSTLLYDLVDQGLDCYPLTIKYGQVHSKEVLAARNISEALGLVTRWRLLDLSILRAFLPSALTGVGAIPEGKYNAPSMAQTVVPGRNLTFLSIAAGYAEGLNCNQVAYAAHAGDHFIYPDCRPEFVEAAANAVFKSSGLLLLTPYLQIHKNNIVEIGSKLNVPYWMTWTCYKGGEKHCGKCGSCDERKEAFAKAGVKDPTIYET